VLDPAALPAVRLPLSLPTRAAHVIDLRRSVRLMKKTVLRDQATTADGTLLTLHEHDGAFMIRVDGVELMSSRQHHSEERLAELACAAVAGRRAPRVLIGGLGMGFTLRAALRHLPPDARVIVVELMPAVIAWNLAPEYGLAGDALRDPRVEIVEGDVAAVLAGRRHGFDAVVLDVDNGASGLTLRSNGRLYEPTGLGMARAALAAGGCLAVWSAGDDPAFAERLRRAGFDVRVERAPTHPGGRSRNCLFIGRLPPAGGR
jgi:spermidine synthase